MTVYADDLNKLVLALSHTADELRWKLHRNDEDLDSSLSLSGYAQNRGKQKVNVNMRRIPEQRRVYERQVEIEGECCRTSVMLGAHLHITGSLTPEKRARVQALRAAYFGMGTFWYTKGAKLSAKRLVFISRVQQAALSGLEARPSEKLDCEYLDRALVALLRKAMCGEASRKRKEGEGVSFSALSNVAVC